MLAGGTVLGGAAQRALLPGLPGGDVATCGTIPCRTLGQRWFIDDPTMLALGHLLAVPIAYPAYRRHRRTAGGAVAAPLLPVITASIVNTPAYPPPNLPPSLHSLYDSWCLWACGLALPTALWPRAGARPTAG